MNLRRPKKIVVASNNFGKVREFEKALLPLGFKTVSLQVAGFEEDLREEGDYRENALEKARAVCRSTGLPALADDSGLEVEALGGFPGSASRRYLGPEATQEERNRDILRRLDGVPEKKRGARFRCLLALCFPEGQEIVVEGTCEGTIALSPRGEGGFGYDPIFQLPDGRTMAQLTREEKNQVSHRGKALTRLLALLRGSNDPDPGSSLATNPTDSAVESDKRLEVTGL
jgi:XTP/dITP diphosphohydrolase